MMARSLWWFALAAIALIATLAQMDRASRFNLALASSVPQPFTGFATQQRVRQAILAGNAESALLQGRDLLTTRPLPAEHLSLFAVAAAMNGEEELSIAALELAMQRGWREPMAQQAAAAAALEQDAHDIAAMRIAALYAIGGHGDIASIFAAQLLTTHRGRQAFADRFAASGHWQNQVAGILGETAAPSDFAAAFVLASQATDKMDCARLLQIAGRYERDGFVEAARRLREICED